LKSFILLNKYNSEREEEVKYIYELCRSTVITGQMHLFVSLNVRKKRGSPVV